MYCLEGLCKELLFVVTTILWLSLAWSFHRYFGLFLCTEAQGESEINPAYESLCKSRVTSHDRESRKFENHSLQKLAGIFTGHQRQQKPHPMTAES